MGGGGKGLHIVGVKEGRGGGQGVKGREGRQIGRGVEEVDCGLRDCIRTP